MDAAPRKRRGTLGLSSPIRISPYLLCAVAEHDREITVLRGWDGSPLTGAHAGWGQRRWYPGRLNSTNGVAADEPAASFSCRQARLAYERVRVTSRKLECEPVGDPPCQQGMEALT